MTRHDPVRLRFRERMRGWISFDEDDYNAGRMTGRRRHIRCSLDATVEVRDLNEFLAVTHPSARMHGSVDCPQLGGRLKSIEGPGSGSFELFIPSPDPRRKEIRYRLLVTDPDGRELTFSAFKLIEKKRRFNGWMDTTKLLVRILRGHVKPGDEDQAQVLATGILHVSPFSFTRTMLSMRATRAWIRGPVRFQFTFLRRTRATYSVRGPAQIRFDFPSPRRLDPPDDGDWHPVPHSARLEYRIVPFSTADDCELNLHQVSANRGGGGKPVLLVCGLSMRASSFYRFPGPTLAESLVDAGRDVWALNWRTSIDVDQRDYTLDEAALFDYPAAIATVRDLTGHDRMDAVAHCMGSTSLTMSVLAGLVTELDTIVSSGASLYIDLAQRSRTRLKFLMPVLKLRLDGVDPQWKARAPTIPAALLGFHASRSIKGYDNPLVRAAVYCYGGEAEAMWQRHNLDPAAIEWTAREFGYAPFRCLTQVQKSANAGYLITTERYAELPRNLLTCRPPERTKFVLVAGAKNRFFLPSGQVKTFAHFDELQPGRHSLLPLRDYAHYDAYIGRHSQRDVFDPIVNVLEGRQP